MATKRIVVSGGGQNLYKVSGSGSSYTVSQIIINPIFDDRKRVGTAGSLDDALILIKSHSGKRIEKISNW